MKMFAGPFGAALIALTLTGCGDSTDALTSQAPPPPSDGRPVGFEDMMRGMEKDMKNAGEKPRDQIKATSAASPATPATP